MSWWQSLGLPGAQIDKNSIKFPFEIELVPDILRASIMLSSFTMADEDLVCWTYVSNGLKKVGQKELLISIRKPTTDSVSDFPQAPVEFFKTVFQHALRKEFIDIGSISDFGEDGFLSREFPGAAYIRSQSMGDWFPPEESLSMVLMKAEELAASQFAGLTRVLALLGKSSLHFPCPVWNDLGRKTVITEETLKTMSESFIAQMPRILIRDSGVSSEDRVINLQLPLSSRHYFKQLSELDKQTPLLLLTDLDERADAVLVWQEDKKVPPLAISAPGTEGNRIAGSFICFAPDQTSDHGMIIEDGFVLSTKQETWDELRNSLVNGSPFYLAREDEGYDFKLAWHQDEDQAAGPDTIEISGIDLGCRGGVSKIASEEKITVPAYATEISLLTHEAEIRRAIQADVLRRYIEHIEDIVRDHFMCMGESDGFDLSLLCTLLPERKVEFEASSNPIMEAEDETDLLDRLSIIYAPEISEGKIKFKIDLAVWGGSSNSKFEPS